MPCLQPQIITDTATIIQALKHIVTVNFTSSEIMLPKVAQKNQIMKSNWKILLTASYDKLLGFCRSSNYDLKKVLSNLSDNLWTEQGVKYVDKVISNKCNSKKTDAETRLHCTSTVKRIKNPWLYDLHFNDILSLRFTTYILFFYVPH